MNRKKQKPMILMVDDQKDFLDIVKGWAAPEFNFLGVEDSSNLRELVDRHDPSLLVLDLYMPDAQGFDLCREIRADPRHRDLPILFLTGSRENADFLRNFKAGGTAYLMKPIARTQLLGMFRELIVGADESVDIATGD